MVLGCSRVRAASEAQLARLSQFKVVLRPSLYSNFIPAAESIPTAILAHEEKLCQTAHEDGVVSRASRCIIPFFSPSRVSTKSRWMPKAKILRRVGSR